MIDNKEIKTKIKKKNKNYFTLYLLILIKINDKKAINGI
jgi:hypothetical protein